MGYGGMSNTVPRHARVAVGNVTPGETMEWDTDVDVDGNHLPARITITDFIVDQPVSTIRAIRIFAKSSRIDDPANAAEHSLIYEDNWTEYTEASDEQTADRTGISYIDEDEDQPSPQEATIWGTMDIEEDEDASTFLIDIYFTERG